MQRYTIFFIIVKLYMFQAVSPPIIMSSNSTTLTVAASKPGTYQMVYVQFLSS